MRIRVLLIILVTALIALGSAGYAYQTAVSSWVTLQQHTLSDETNTLALTPPQGEVLQATDNIRERNIKFNVPAIFNEETTFNANITAPNVIYSLTAGTGITITGDQDLTISAAAGITSIQNQTGDITFTAGDGLSIDGLAFTNTDRGSAQNIFKTIKASGQSDITAGSNNDSLTFIAGTGISVTTNNSTKELTITASGTASPWQKVSNAVSLITSSDNVGIGTDSPSEKLSVAGNITATGSITLANIASGASFTGYRLTQTDTTGNLSTITDGTNGQVLSTDGSGNLTWTTVSTSGNTFVQDGNTFSTTATLGTNDTQSLVFETNNTQRIMILSTGNVGIGDMTPASLFTVGANDAFQVNSSGAITSSTGISSSGNLFFTGSGTYTLANIASGASFSGNRVVTTSQAGLLSTVPGGSNNQFLKTDGSGNLSWSGVTTIEEPTNAFITGGNTFGADASLGTNDTFNLAFETNALPRMTILSTGNIGIGDASPTSLFTVGAGDAFQVNSSGAIAAATGITSSGTITFTALGSGTGSFLCLDGSNQVITCAAGAGDITSVGDVVAGAAFDGTQGNALQFEGTTADGNEITLQGADANADRTITLPNRSGTIILSGDTYSGDVTATLENDGDTALTIAADAVALTTDTTGNYVASIVSGAGLTGGVASEGAAATLAIGGGSGITVNPDDIALGDLTEDWDQGGAFDILLNNAASEIRILESTGGTFYGTFDVGDLGADQTYTFTTGGTVWTAGNDGAGSGLDADTLDTISSGSFLRSDTNDSFTSGTLTLDSGTTLQVDGTATINGTTNINGSATIGDASADALTINAEILGGSPLVFEGATNDGTTTTIAVTDPTSSNKTITLPNRSGTLILSGDTFSGDVTATLENDGDTALTIAANSVALTTDTTGNYVASFTAGNGLTGDASGEGSTPTLAVNTGNGIQITSDSVALGTFTAEWDQTGAFDLFLNNASSELKILGSGAAESFYGQFDVTDLSANRTYTFPDATGEVCLSTGNCVSAGDISAVGDVASGAAFDGTQGNALQFEGATANGFETTLTSIDPTSDNTINLPDASGTIILSGHTLSSDVTGTFDTDGDTALTIAADAVALGTDTTGTYIAAIVAGNGLTGDANTEGATATLDIGAGSGISVGTNAVSLGDLTANWDQTGAFDIVLNNQSSELSIRESNGTFLATIDIGDLAANRLITLTDIGSDATVAYLEGSQTFSGAKTFDAGLTIGASQTISIAGDSISDFSGTGLQVSGGSLSATLGTDIIGSEIVDGTIEEGDLEVTNAPTDDYVLTYDQASGGFTWVDGTTLGSTSAISRNAGSGFIYPTTVTDDLILGANAVADAPFFFDVSAGTITLEGATANSFETLIALTDPTADNTITYPDASGTIILSGHSFTGGDVTGTLDTDGTTVLTVAADAVALSTDTTGNYIAAIVAGNGLTGDANSEGATATLEVGAGSGISVGANAVSLGALTANWNQTGAFDIVLNNAGSELQILESTGGTFFATFDVGDLSANRIITFTDIGSDATVAFLEGSQTFTGAKTFDAGLTIGASQTISIAGDSISDFSGTGLQVSGGSLSATLGTDIVGSEIVDGTIEEGDLEVTNAPTDDYVLTYDQASGGFTWVDGTTLGSTSAISRNAGSGFIYPTTVTDDLILGANAVGDAPFFFDVSAGTITLEGATANSFETLIALTDPTADNTITYPDASGTIILSGHSFAGGDVTGTLDTDGSTVLTVAADAVALSTDTTGNYIAAIVAGNGLTGDASSEGATASLAVGAGSGISVAADAVALGALTANWNQTGAFDIVLNNAGSELQILESTGGTFFATIDVGDLSANRLITLTDIGSDATVAYLEGSQTFTGAKTFDAGLTISASQTIAIAGDSISDFTGTGLQMSGNSLTTTLGTDISGTEIIDGTIEEVDLEATNSATNGYILSFDSTSGGFTWVENNGGSGGSKWTTGSSTTYLTNVNADFNVGASDTLAAPFSVDVSGNLVRIGDGANDANNPTLAFYASNASDSATISLDDNDDFVFTGADVNFGGGVLGAGLSDCDASSNKLLWDSSTNQFSCGTDAGSGSGGSKWTEAGSLTYLTTTGNAVTIGSNSTLAKLAVDADDTAEISFLIQTAASQTAEALVIENNLGTDTFVIDAAGNVDAGVWTATAIGAAYGGTGIDTSGATGVPYISSGTWSTEAQLALTRGGTGASLADPNADRILFWDDSAGASAWLSIGTGLDLTGTTLSHADTSSQASSDNSGTTVIQDLTLDGMGHITGLSTVDLSSSFDNYQSWTVDGDDAHTQTIGSTETLIFTGGTGIDTDVSDTNDTITFNFDLTEVNGNQTFGDGSTSATATWTIGLSGATDPTIGFANNGMTFTAGSVAVVGNLDVSGTFTAGTADAFQINSSGTITSGTWNSTAIGAGYGGTGIDTSGATGVPYISSGTWSTEAQLALTRGGTGASLADPNADRLLFWDDSAGSSAWLSIGTGLDLTGTTLSHADTSSQASSDNSAQTVIQDITLDGMGHITGISTVDLSSSFDNYQSWTVDGDDGDTQTISSTETLIFTGGTGIDTDVSNASDTVTFNLDLTEINGNQTIGDGTSNATATWTIGLSGATDPTIGFANNGMTFTAGSVAVVGNLDISGTFTSGTADAFTINSSGTITSGTWNGTAIGAAYGGTGIDTSGATGVPYISSGTWSTEAQLALTRGGTGASLADPNADRILFWDDSAGASAWLSIGTGLDLTGTTLSHADTSSQASSDNSGTTVIQDLTLDGMGHITGLSTIDLSSSFDNYQSWTVDGDDGDTQTIASTQTLIFTGGTGIDTDVNNAADEITFNFDPTEVNGNQTFGDGSTSATATWSIGLSGATDPSLGFANNAITLTAGSTTVTGDLTISGNGLTFGNTETIDNDTNGQITITASTTQLSGILDVNGGDGSDFAGSVTFNDDIDTSFTDTENLAIVSAVTGTNSADVTSIALTNQTTSGTQRGLVLSNANDAANAVTEAMIAIDNTETTASTLTDAIIVTSSGVNGGVVDALDVSAANITNAINAGANFITLDAMRLFEGTTGTFTVEDTSGNDLLTIVDNSNVGDVTATGTLSVLGSTIGLNSDADADNLLGLSAASGEAGSSLYWGNRLLCDPTLANCGWATAASSPWTTDSNVVNLSTDGDTVTVGSSTNLAKLAVDGDADEIQMLVQGNGTQNASLLVLETSAGTDVMTVSNGGALALEGSISDITDAAVTINDSLTLTGNTLTFGNAETIDNTSNGQITITASTTQLSGVLDVNGGDGSDFAGSVAFNDDIDTTFTDTENLAIVSTVTGTNSADVTTISLTNQSSSGTQRGLVFTNANDAANAVTEAMISIDNAETTASTLTDAIIVTSSGVNDGVVDALDASAANITNALNAGANFLLFDGIRGFSASAGNFTIEDTSGNDLLSLVDGGTITIGSSAVGTQSISLVTDGTGDAEIALPNDSIGITEVNDNGATPTDEYCLSYESTGSIFEWKDCNATTYTFSNGLTETGGTVKLGGTLTEDTTIAFGASTFGLVFNNNGSDNITTNLSSTGDFVVQDNGVAYFTLSDDSTTTWTLPTAGYIQIDASATDTTTTAGVLDLNVDAGNAAVTGIDLNFTQSDGATAATDAVAQKITLSANDADGDMFGLQIIGGATANAAAGSYEAAISIDNAENTAASMTDAILITSSGANNGITDAIDVSAANINNALNVANNFILFDGIRAFATGSTNLTIEDTDGNDLMTITDSGTTGSVTTTGATTLSTGAGTATTIGNATGTFEIISNTIDISTAGALSGATGISSSGNLEFTGTGSYTLTNIASAATFSGTRVVTTTQAGLLATIANGNANDVLKVDGSGVLSFAAPDTLIADDTLDFTEFQDTLDLDASTNINLDDDASQYTLTITSDLSVAARSTDALVITQANNASNNNTGNLLQITNADVGSTAALFSLDQGSTGASTGMELVFTNTSGTQTNGLLLNRNGAAGTTTNAINITETAGDFTNGINIGSGVGTAIVLQNGETIDNTTNGTLNLARVDTGALTFLLTSDTSATISTSTGDLTLDPAGGNIITTDILNVGSTAQNYNYFSNGAPSSVGTVDGAGDLFISDELEVNGLAQFDGILYTTSDVTIDLDAAETIAISNSGQTANNLININTDFATSTANSVGLNVDITNLNDANAETHRGQYLRITNNGTTTDDTMYGLQIDNTSSSSAALDAAIYINNANASQGITTGLLFGNTGSGGYTNFIDTPSSVFKVDASGNITGVNITSTGNITLSSSTGLLDLSAITHATNAVSGLKLPQASLASGPSSGEGFIAYDTDDDQVKVWNGSSWNSISGASTTFDDVYANSITATNLTMEIDDTTGLTFDMTTTGDFNIQDNGTTFAQFDDSGKIGFGGNASGSDYLLNIDANTTNDWSRALSVTQSNNANEDSSVFVITNTAAPGTVNSVTRNISNIGLSLTPQTTITSSGVIGQANIASISQTLNLSSVTLSDTSNQVRTFADGESITITGSPVFNDSLGNNTSSLVARGLNSTISLSPTLTSVMDASYTTTGGAFINTSTSAGDVNLVSTAYGISSSTTGNLTTTGTTSHFAGHFTATGTADNNYGLYVNSVSDGTNNYGLYLNTIASASTNWAIYSAATAQSYMAGNLGIGTDTTADAVLEVEQNSALSTDLVALVSSGATTTTGIDGLQIDFTTGDGSNPTNNGINLNLTSGGTASGDVLNGITFALTGTSGTERGLNFSDNNFDTDINGTTDLTLAINGTNELILTASALAASTDSGLDLGTSSSQFADLYLDGGNINLDNATDIDIDDNLTSAFTITSGSDEYFAISTNNGAPILNLNTQEAGGTINLGSSNFAKTINLGTGTAADTINIGTGATSADTITFGNTGVASTFTFNTGVASTSGLTLNANSLSSGTGLNVSSSSTALTTGALAKIDWSPTTTTATGDLLHINIGANGNIGNLLNITDNNSTLFSVSETGITANLPAAFNGAGDVAIANDLQFTNQTASFIKSKAPLTIEAGENFESNDLTLKTYNNGVLVFDTASAQFSSITGLLDLSNITHASTTVQGLKLPQNTALTNPSTGEGFLAWDTDDNQIKVFDGSSWSNISGASTTLQQAYDYDADGSDATITLSNEDDSIIFTNPNDGANDTDSAFMIHINQASTAATTSALDITQSSNAADAVNITANSIDTENVLDISATGLTTGNAINVALTEATLNGGYYFRAYDNTAAAAVFTIGEDGNTTIAGLEGSNMLTLTAGDAVISDGSLAVTDDDDAVSFSVTNNTATTIGAGVNTAGIVDLSSTSLTTGNLLNLEANGLTSGTALQVGSTSTSTTTVTSGMLGYFNWAPGSSTTKSGDLLRINIGANGNIGNLLNITDAGSTLFSVSESSISANIPASFNASGDTSMAYDLVFTNQTSSNIKSYGPLTIESGESFENNPLTLKTYGTGTILLDPSSTGSIQLAGATTFGTVQTLANDATPDVAAGSYFVTGGTTTITDFDAGSGTLNDGHLIFIRSAHTVTITCNASTELACGATGDIGLASGDLISFLYDASNDVWRLVNWFDASDASQSGADLAEFYITEDSAAVEGDLVSIDPSNPLKVKLSDQTSASDIIGVISTDPHTVMGESDTQGFGVSPVALAGRVPVNVTTENGNIKAGDFITISKTKPGIGMKSTSPSDTIVGKAISDYINGDTNHIGQVNMFVNLQWSRATGQISDASTVSQNPADTTGSQALLADAIIYNTVLGTLTFKEDSTFQGSATFEQVAQFLGKVEFKGEVTFAEAPSFPTQMAGYTSIPAGETTVDIVFSKPFSREPIVTVSPLDNSVQYVITQRNEQGFTIELKEPTNNAVMFSWIALPINEN